MGSLSVLQEGEARALRSRRFGAFQLNVLVRFKDDVRPSKGEPWAACPSFRRVGLGPCEGNFLEPFSRFQRRR